MTQIGCLICYIVRGEKAQGLNISPFAVKSNCISVMEMTSTVCKPERTMIL